MKKSYLSILLLGLFFMASCDKDDDDSNDDNNTPDTQQTADFPEAEADAAAYLSSAAGKVWAAQSFDLMGIGVLDCRLDDQMTLKDDGTFMYNSGPVKCGGVVDDELEDDDQDVKEGTWMLDFENKTLWFNKGEENEYSATISKLSENSIEVEGSWSEMGITGTYSAD